MRFYCFLFFCLLSLKQFAYAGEPDTLSLDKKRKLAYLVRDFSSNVHYSPRKFDEQLSKDWFVDFFTKIDPLKKILLREDSVHLSIYKKKLHRDILAAPEGGNFEFFQRFKEVYTKRVQRLRDFFADSIYWAQLNLQEEDYITFDDKHQFFALSEKEQFDRWKKQVKWMILQQTYDPHVSEDSLQQQERDTLSAPEKELKARNYIVSYFRKNYQKLSKIKEEELFGAYMNSLMAVFDPHSGYYEPKKKEEFNESISGKFEGIGARLGTKDQGFLTYVTEVVAGGPAAKQAELQAGDIILKVAQGDGEPENIQGMLVSDVVSLIRGKKGTWVKLTVRKPDQTVKVIAIQRDVVEMEDTFAKSFLLQAENASVGYISLPSFYVDLSRAGPQRNSADDVRKAIEQLNAQKVAGIIIDLRNNTGGSLQDVVQIANSFVSSEAVVQVRARDQSVQPLRDYAQKLPMYTGPLVILVNEYSASASEILAAAMQDYHRGVIIGSSSTFGKGTVQRFFELDQYVAGVEGYGNLTPFGSIKLTIQKFYRVSGLSTQLRGVHPDIIIPAFAMLEEDEDSEKKQNFAMPCDSIAPLNSYKAEAPDFFPKIIARSEERLQHNYYFQLLREKQKVIEEEYRKDKRYSLQPAIFQQAKQSSLQRLKQYDTLNKLQTTLNAQLLIPSVDTLVQKKDKKLLELIQKDFQIEEAFRVILDLVPYYPKPKNDIF